jgi:enamine deaminase RidA (YjgF/YER057c/UK114 family)
MRILKKLLAEARQKSQLLSQSLAIPKHKENDPMSSSIETRLQELGITLPVAAAPAANYVPFTRTGSLLLTSGQLPLADGKLVHNGLLGAELNVAQGKEAAKACAINILAQAKAALGDLEKITRIVKITVFVASTPDFTEQHLVANGASDLLVAVLGDAGRHARSAVGSAALPLNAPVEIEAIIEVR